MKKKILVMLLIVFLVVVVLIFVFYLRSCCEKSDNYLESRAVDLYNVKKAQGVDFDSQCLGILKGVQGNYVVDIVHVPRSAEDNLPENQCEAYRNGTATHFIELDKKGNIVRIV